MTFNKVRFMVGSFLVRIGVFIFPSGVKMEYITSSVPDEAGAEPCPRKGLHPLARARHAAGWTQIELAGLSRVSRAAIQKTESWNNRLYKSSAVKLAGWLEVEADTLRPAIKESRHGV